MAHAPAADRTELHLEAFATSRPHAGREVGRHLLAAVIREANSRGAEQVRADCWAGGEGRLVRYHEQRCEESRAGTRTYFLDCGP
ncbi:GNAT family N-acetyltransferase [Frankia canadensis]|uniref:GNAT family N-acetyltransferase n=1 Tax=Frankia canadensis TaxID=1836972 RepID=UPI003C2CDB13